MIRYALACDNGHEFDSWFPSVSSFDAQAASGLVECPACASVRVEKRIMSPSLASGAKAPPAERPASGLPAVEGADSAPSPPQPVAILSERDVAIRAMMRAVREHVTKTADYVGPGFAAEARRMHYGETPHRSIYGEANAGDAQALLEEGIEVHALPAGPDDRN